jgi:hypothetical protein
MIIRIAVQEAGIRIGAVSEQIGLRHAAIVLSLG